MKLKRDLVIWYQNRMGHARLETTAIYLQVIGEEERELAKRLWKTL